MSLDQTLIALILLLAFAGFLWGRFRHDVIAFLALIMAGLAGLVPAEGLFSGFGHPATLTVAFVLILSRGLHNSGIVSMLNKVLIPPFPRPEAQIGAAGSIAAILSAFMNNIGALALIMPAAIASTKQAGRTPATILMPLSFASILGGLITLIGTPPNIIVALFREERTGESFAMFDFAPVGLAVALGGILFIALVGWRLIPTERRAAPSVSEAFSIEDFVSEARIPRGSQAIGKRLQELDASIDEHDAVILEVLRRGRRIAIGGRRAIIRSGDLLLIESSPEHLAQALKALDAVPAAKRRTPGRLLGGADITILEAVIGHDSPLVGRTAQSFGLRRRYGANLLAVSRSGTPIHSRLRDFLFREGDVILLEGDTERLADAILTLRCLPLASRSLPQNGLAVGLASVALFALAILAAIFGLTSLPIAFGAAAAAMVLFNFVPLRDLYDSIDWPVIILIGAMIPVGTALETTGLAVLLAETMIDLFAGASAIIFLVLIMVLTMTLSDVINNAATAVIMAPIAAGLAASLGVNSDPFLMAVAVAASCAFLTPIGHQNNTLVMGPGGYRFGDYWRLGLPLEVLVIAIAIPVLLRVWPL